MFEKHVAAGGSLSCIPSNDHNCGETINGELINGELNGAKIDAIITK